MDSMKRLLVVLAAAGALWALSGAAQAREPAAVGDIPAAALPREAHATLALIKAGGPFPYVRDGSVFGNREKRLPPRARGYYREYTVPTPGTRSRGARRIIAGAGTSGDARSSGEYYYTDDHYNSFRRIRE
jgi:ribonuclease T1